MSSSKASPTTKCQKCLELGHWRFLLQTYECKNNRVYKARPTRTQQLTKPLKPISVELPKDLDPKDSSSSSSDESSSSSSSDSESDSSATASSSVSSSGSSSDSDSGSSST
ncbi:16634_t:CDS:2, partial [Acaulospora morrowiae]